MSESRSEKDGSNASSIVQLLTEHEILNIVEQIAIVNQENMRIVVRVNY
jgi:hypothetical protein